MPQFTNFTPVSNNLLYQYLGYVFDTAHAGAVTIYSGEQPTAATIASNWTSYNSGNTICLAHWATGPSWAYNSGTTTYYNTNNPSTTAINTGTASWAILWRAGSSVSALALSAGSIPNSVFGVFPVSSTTGTGIIRLASTSIVGGSSVQIGTSGYTTQYAS